ncbi:right-handed parallel beta-helix repeat-containing protein [Lysobacter sp. LF1]|uniref:Right-handed parallel beta-helix repeat-containing protein n=1 Tax=Lysobacter stagni TaxID=3045172 RepID=A0ABT6XJB3_9GAMM|nr:right-handed parallel beta-helix repeat-containing protein [Lysobacter sp. LF1]MDI9240251.1 right-handed parallel beta-helix repeat-containing protein [Lysobacter sp. LF1]
MPDRQRRRVSWCLLLAPAAPVLVYAAAPARGDAKVDVRDYDARGNGVADDTRAFQAAINALPDSGGTVQVPPGDYLINPVVGVQLRDRMHLAMAPGTRLMAKPNAAERAYVLNVNRVEDVEISGGRIIGERGAHLGSTGEWGHGVMIRGSQRVTVRDIHISHCWGDGISIGGAKEGGRIVPSRDITIQRVQSIGNRRQGLTIGRSRQVRVYDSTFADTEGTLPASGIDVEPDAGDMADDVLIARCIVRGNRGAGIQLYKQVSNAIVRECTIEDNRGAGILTLGARQCTIEDNRIRLNALGGIAVRPGTRELTIARNEFSDNGPRIRTKDGSARKGKRHVAIGDATSDIRVDNDNRYLD